MFYSLVRLAVLLLTAFAAVAHAQVEDEIEDLANPFDKAKISKEEVTALALAEAGQSIAAREKAEAILKDHDSSFMAHLVLGKVLREAEASYPRALFHLKRALSLFEQTYGPSPPPELPWQFHAVLLQELAETLGDLERHQERLDVIARFNELYDPDMLAEQAWPLMKLGRYREAKLAAEQGLVAQGRSSQRFIALNALCAIEFEAGQDGASYDACKRAVDDARASGRTVSSVDLTNLSEAARSLFRLDEAERYAMEATKAPISYYGNPWLDLAELYTREGRFAEALAALKEIPSYRAQRPPETRLADMNESRRALSAFLLTLSKADEALELTEQALVRPDRRAHHSRDDVQDEVVAALLDREARLLSAQLRLEKAAALPWYARWLERLKVLPLQLSAWHSGRLAARLLSEPKYLIGTFRLGTASAAIMPPWLLGELCSVLGPAVVVGALKEARRMDQRPNADAYYDALQAEATLQQGEYAKALSLAERALAKLGKGEVLLRARVHALAARAAEASDRPSVARPHLEAAFQEDPGVFRRLQQAVPVRIVARDPLSQEIGDAALNSPRFTASAQGLTLRIEPQGSGAKACLLSGNDAVIACGQSASQAPQGVNDLVSATLLSLQEEAFSPRVTLSAADINSLDGSNLVGRGALEDALGK